MIPEKSTPEKRTGRGRGNVIPVKVAIVIVSGNLGKGLGGKKLILKIMTSVCNIRGLNDSLKPKKVEVFNCCK